MCVYFDLNLKNCAMTSNRSLKYKQSSKYHLMASQGSVFKGVILGLIMMIFFHCKFLEFLKRLASLKFYQSISDAVQKFIVVCRSS